MIQRRRVFSMLLLATITLAPSFASAQSATGMAGQVIGANDQVTNAAQAAEEALKSAATKGESTRGASGAIASLLTSSDKLICSAWIVSFRVRYRNMVLEGADAKALGAMQKLMETVEKECDKILNPEGQKNVKVGGGGEPIEEEDTPKPIYPACPECDPLKVALDQRTYEFEHAQWELNKSMRWTDFVEAAHASGESKAAINKATGGETPESAERSESKMRAKVSNARMAMDAARAKLVECLERCNNRNKKKYSFLGNNTQTYALAGGIGVGVGVLVTGGGDEPANQTFNPGPTTVASADPVVPVAPATPAVAAYMACAGGFDSIFDVSRDPGNHREFVWMPRNMLLNVNFGSVHIRGSEPFVEVSGSINENGTFDASGSGTVAGFRNVSVRMSGSLTGCSETAGTMNAVYSMGNNGELPGGQAIVYSVRGSK